MEPEAEKAGVSGRVLAVVIVVIILAAAVTGGLFTYFRSGAAQSAHSQSGSANSQTSPPGSIFGGPSYSLQVTKVSVAQSTQSNGYILNVDASYAGTGTWQVNPDNFEIISVSSAVYKALPAYSITGMTTPLSAVVLANGQHAIGELGFSLPLGQTPSQLEYLNQSSNINVRSQGIPSTLTYVCQTPGIQVMMSNSSVQGSVAYYQPTTYASQTPYYLSGNQIIVPLTASIGGLGLVGQTQNSNLVTEVSTNSSGAAIGQIRPQLPLSLPASFNVTVSTPSATCVRTLNIQVTIASALRVTSASFSAQGPSGTIKISNSGLKSITIQGVSLSYTGGSCSVSVSSGSGSVPPNSVYVFTWSYGNSAPCGGQVTAGQQFSGTVTFTDGEKIPFSGAFQSSQVSPTAAHVVVTNVFFSASGTEGAVTLTNTGTATVYIQGPSSGSMYASLTYGGVTCGFASGGASIEIAPGSSATEDFPYGSGSSCGGPVSVGEPFSGWIDFSDGEQVQFSGVFQSAPAPQFTVTATNLRASDFISTGNSSKVEGCGSTDNASYITIQMSPNAAGFATSVTITWAGASNVFTLSVSCIPAGSASKTVNLLFPSSSKVTSNAVAGQSFTGYVSWSDGSQVVFTGTWQSSGGVAQVAVTSASLQAAGFGTGTAGDFTCVTSAPSTPYITLTNTGTASLSVTSVTITWAGANNQFAPHAGTTCVVGAGGSANGVVYVEFTSTPKVSTAAVTGQSYSGYVTLSNGAQVLFTGTWQ